MYSAIVVEPIPEKRLRLRQAAAAAPCFERVEPMQSFAEALRHLEGLQRCDVIFIGDLGAQDAKGFIEKAKRTPQGKLSAYIFLRQQKALSTESAALDVIAGADSILYAPFSVEDVVSTTRIADQIKQADAEGRKKAAMSLMISNVMTEVDHIGEAAQKAAAESTPKLGLGKLKSLAEQLRQAAKTAAVDYLGTLSKAFVEAKPPVDKNHRQDYGGVSARVQRIIDRKKRDEADQK